MWCKKKGKSKSCNHDKGGFVGLAMDVYCSECKKLMYIFSSNKKIKGEYK